MALIIFCEDKYGVDFFKKLAIRLKNEGVFPHSMAIDSDKFYGSCNPKLIRQMTVKALKYQDFLIIADGDNGDATNIESKILCHIPAELADKTHVVILKYEVEEWICVSEQMPINDKPSTILRLKYKYEKYKLEDYAQRLDIKRLSKKSKSFRHFVNCVCGPSA